DPEPCPLNPNPQTRNPNPEIRNPKPESRNPHPRLRAHSQKRLLQSGRPAAACSGQSRDLLTRESRPHIRGS
ncbi:hypothetical protein T484DRAFT_1649337, partial [Baffinella frigidus]